MQEYEFQVKKEDISFEICAYIDGCFNNPNAPDHTFKDAADYLLMLYKNTGYMPQYGDSIWCDRSYNRTPIPMEDRFVIVSKDFALDDYCTITLCVVPEEVFYKQWR